MDKNKTKAKLTTAKKKTSSIIKKAAEKTKKGTAKVKEKSQEVAKKTQKAYNSPTGKKIRGFVKKASTIVGSHLATMKAGLTLSNEESNLLEELKIKLNAKGYYPSKSEIIRAGLHALKGMKTEELVIKLQGAVTKVKKTRIL